MIHDVVAEFSAVVAEPVRKPLRFGVHQDGRRANGTGVEKDDLGKVLSGLFGFCVNNPDASSPLGFVVVDNGVDNAVGHQRQVPGIVGNGNGGR